MTHDDQQLLQELRRFEETRVWRQLLKPALDEARKEALAAITDTTNKTAAERGEHAHEFNAVDKLAKLVPERLKELERDHAERR